VRLAPAHAAQLYSMVEAEGATITIGGSPASARYAARGHGPRFAAHRAHGGGALAYASQRRAAHHSVRAWQANPTGGFPGLFGN
jgi:hypothetical protein